MRVKCLLCDEVESINSSSLQAKKLRSLRTFFYLCEACNDRIGKKTKVRKASGQFREYREKKKDPYIS